MKLSRIATHFNAPEFEYLDPTTRQWMEGFSGRLAISDRFLSNFNRPTRKRMLYTGYDVDLSSWDVARLKSTGEIYLLGVSRRDTFKTNGTTQLTVCHMVTPGLSAGVAAIERPTVAGSGDDLGWVVMQPVAESYLDLELRATSREPGSKEVEVGSYYGFAEAHGDIVKGDRMTLNGIPYVVDEVAYDSEFKMLRMTDRDVHYVDMVFTIATGTPVRNRVTGEYETAEVTRNVSGLWVDLHDTNNGFSPDAVDYSEVRISVDHIGFDPKPDMAVQLDGKAYTVAYVELAEYRRQWIVRLK